MNDDISPELREKLRQAAHDCDQSDWPKWRRGCQAALWSVLPAGLLGGILGSCRAEATQVSTGLTALGVACLVAICVGLAVAFRPLK